MNSVGLIKYLALGFLFISCASGVKKDAERAAELVNKSKEATLNYDLESAEKFYKEYQEIKNKYKNTDNNNEFEKTYWEYLTNAKK